MGGITGKLFGSGKSRSGIERMTPEEQKRLQEIESELTQLLGKKQPGEAEAAQFQQDTQPLADAFKSILADTLSQNFGSSPEAQAKAREYVQATFTRPAEERLKQFTSDFEAQQRARAASLGRDPNLDYETNRGIYSELARQQANLAAEEGSRVAQRPYELAQFQLGAGLQGLGGLQQRSSFINDLGQRALQNRLTLLNARSGIGDAFYRERAAQQFEKGPSPGLLGYWGATSGFIANEFKKGSDVTKSIYGLPTSNTNYQSNPYSGD